MYCKNYEQALTYTLNFDAVQTQTITIKLHLSLISFDFLFSVFDLFRRFLGFIELFMHADVDVKANVAVIWAKIEQVSQL